IQNAVLSESERSRMARLSFTSWRLSILLRLEDKAVKSARTLLLVPRAPRTVTWNVQEAELSVAVQRTVVVPMGKMLPEGGTEVTTDGPEHPAVAVGLNETWAPLASVNSTLILSGQVIWIGEEFWTMMRELQELEAPWLSLTVSVTALVPTG